MISQSLNNIKVFSKILKIELSRDEMLMRQNRKKLKFLSFNSFRKFKNDFIALFFLYYFLQDVIIRQEIFFHMTLIFGRN